MCLNVKYPCSICNKNVQNNHLAIECSNCNLWSHIKCNNIDRNQYKCYQENPDETFFCLMCIEEEIPFTKLHDNEFESFLKFDNLRSVKDSKFLLWCRNKSHVNQTVTNTTVAGGEVHVRRGKTDERESVKIQHES